MYYWFFFFGLLILVGKVGRSVLWKGWVLLLVSNGFWYDGFFNCVFNVFECIILYLMVYILGYFDFVRLFYLCLLVIMFLIEVIIFC